MNKGYLLTIPEEVTLTPEVFKQMMNQYKHYRSVSYTFSKKHTNDILNYRKSSGKSNIIPGNVYNLPITYNADITGVK
jgi:hypothetical protein